VVIGGLIQDSFNDGVGKVPLLGDIPVLGGLFKYNTRSRSKTNLMVFLRPTVLRDALSASPLSSERYNYILGEQNKLKPANAPSDAVPSLPPSPKAEGDKPVPPQ
jgi:general secretion pathway protein D